MNALTFLTVFHTALSFLALFLGLFVVVVLLGAGDKPRLVGWFLATAIITTLTGFLFPFHGFTPAIGVGIVSCVILAVGLIARYALHRRGGWRHADTLALILTEYLLVFVGIAQAFLKVPSLHALAPTGTETPFKVSQAVLLTVTVIVAILAIRRSRQSRPAGRFQAAR